MRLSEQRTKALYSAISEPITGARIKVARLAPSLTPRQVEQLDAYLYYAEQEIWRQVEKALNLPTQQERSETDRGGRE